jgi:hypothetical protein
MRPHGNSNYRGGGGGGYQQNQMHRNQSYRPPHSNNSNTGGGPAAYPKASSNTGVMQHPNQHRHPNPSHHASSANKFHPCHNNNNNGSHPNQQHSSQNRTHHNQQQQSQNTSLNSVIESSFDFTLFDSIEYPFCADHSNYELLAKIGQGTYGTVFKGKCKKTNRVVALKKLVLEKESEGVSATFDIIKKLLILKFCLKTKLVPDHSAQGVQDLTGARA